MAIVNDNEDEGTGTPIIVSGGTTFAYVKHQNVYMVCATKKNANMMMMFVFLHKLIEVNSAAARRTAPAPTRVLHSAAAALCIFAAAVSRARAIGADTRRSTGL